MNLRTSLPTIVALSLLAAVSVLVYTRLGDESAARAGFPRFFCAAGMQKPVTAIATRYERDTRTRIELTFGGSGTLLSNLEVSSQGDIYLTVDGGQAIERGVLAMRNGMRSPGYDMWRPPIGTPSPRRIASPGGSGRSWRTDRPGPACLESLARAFAVPRPATRIDLGDQAGAERPMTWSSEKHCKPASCRRRGGPFAESLLLQRSARSRSAQRLSSARNPRTHT